MDDRVIPFGFPEIPGGASGGASIDPTPTPSSVIYDLSECAAINKGMDDNSTAVGNVHVGNSVSGKIQINRMTFSGIVPVDLTGVSRVIITGNFSDLFFTLDGTDKKSIIELNDGTAPAADADFTKSLTIMSFKDGNITVDPDLYISQTNWNTYVKDKQIIFKWPLTIEPVDSNGDAMATYNVEASL